MPEAILFDLDGVIVDSEPKHIAAFDEIFLEILGGRPHGMDLHSYIGRSDQAVWTDFIARHQPPHDPAHLTSWKQDHYLEILRREQPIYPAIPALVRNLAARHPLAVASGSVHRIIAEVLALQDLRRHFSAIASVEDVGIPKPAPDVFLHAARLLGVEPAGCWVIEDSAAGVAAARAAGMRVIGITNTLPAEKLQDATAVISDYDALRRLLLP